MRNRNTGLCLRALALLSIALLVKLAPQAAGQDYAPQYSAAANLSQLRFEQTYYAQIHNTYAHSNHLTNWLDAGYRTVELDVLDTSGWDTNPNGPYVAHGPEAEVHNCSGQRLGNCLRDLAGWVDRNGSNVPIVVLIDMKTSVTQPIAWLPSTISNLDEWVSSFLGSRMYRYSDLAQSVGSDGSDMRARVKAQGWPLNSSLQGRFIIGLTGGQYGHVNQVMRTSMDNLKGDANTFMCPDVDAGDPDEISGTIDGMDEASSRRFVCANIHAGDHMETSLNRSSDGNQLIHIWGASGDFKNTDYAYNYIAVAHGGSLIGWDSSISKTDSSTWVPDFQESLPLVGARRGVPGYFEMINHASKQCVDIDRRDYSNGTMVRDWSCNGGDNQKFVYTAEGQLRPKGDNKYCVDIEGGGTTEIRNVHLWDCDGGTSEKWRINPRGNFETLNMKLNLDLWHWNANEKYVTHPNNHGANQVFTLRKAADWLPSNY
jgi:hypothetical protein